MYRTVSGCGEEGGALMSRTHKLILVYLEWIGGEVGAGVLVKKLSRHDVTARAVWQGLYVLSKEGQVQRVRRGYYTLG